MTACRIVYARPSDASLIARLVGELLHEIMAAIGEAAFTYSAAQTEARVRTWLSEGTYTVVLARVGEETAGLLTLAESRSLYAGGLLGTIPELYVRPAFRAQRIGAALIAEAKSVARGKQWTRLEVTTPPLPPFERSLLFYERQGFMVTGGRKMKVILEL